MTRLILELGAGNDLYGEDYTKAACRAVQDALHHSSLTLFRTLNLAHGDMQVNVTIGVQSVLMPENGHGLAILAEKARQTGADYFVIKPFSYNPLNEYDGGRPLDLVREFENILREAEALTTDDFAVIVRRNTFSDNGVRDYDKCLGLPFITQIAADGKVYSCCPFFGNEDYVLGDLHEHRFQDLWFSDKAEAVRKRVEETQDVHACMTFCRHHQINRQLWQLKNPPDHVNFI